MSLFVENIDFKIGKGGIANQIVIEFPVQHFYKLGFKVIGGPQCIGKKRFDLLLQLVIASLVCSFEKGPLVFILQGQREGILTYDPHGG